MPGRYKLHNKEKAHLMNLLAWHCTTLRLAAQAEVCVVTAKWKEIVQLTNKYIKNAHLIDL